MNHPNDEAYKVLNTLMASRSRATKPFTYLHWTGPRASAKYWMPNHFVPLMQQHHVASDYIYVTDSSCNDWPALPSQNTSSDVEEYKDFVPTASSTPKTSRTRDIILSPLATSTPQKQPYSRSKAHTSDISELNKALPSTFSCKRS